MMYAINKRTKEHRKACGIPGARHGERLVQADDDGWILWEGGECPLPGGVRYDVRCRNGSEFLNQGASFWQRGNVPHDIIAYRPVLDEPEAPEWDGGHLGPVTIESRDSNGSSVCVKDSDGHLHLCPASLIKPIRSAEDKAVESMTSIIGATGLLGGLDCEKVARALYRAGYRKEGDT